MYWIVPVVVIALLVALVLLPERRDKHGFMPDTKRRDWLIGYGILCAVLAVIAIPVVLLT